MQWTIAILMLVAVSSTDATRSGRFEMQLHCSFDLDAGESGCMVTLDGDGTDPPSHAPGKHYDVRLEPRGRHVFLEPRNGASIAVPTGTESGLKGCVAAEYSKRRGQVDGLPPGTYICARTNAGRYAELRIERIAAGDGRAFFAYTVWPSS